MSGDPVEDYLARLRAGLRTPPARTADIVAEAEDHLRESAAARRAGGLDEDAAQCAAIAAFGPVRRVVAAHRPPASAYALALAMPAWPLLCGFLLLTALLGLLLVWADGGGRGQVLTYSRVSDGQGRQVIGTGFRAAGPLAGQLTAVIGGCALAGLLLLAAFLLARRWYARSGRGLVRLPRGMFPLAAATGLLALAFADASWPDVTDHWTGLLAAPAGTLQLYEGGIDAATLLGLGCALQAFGSLAGGPGAGVPVAVARGRAPALGYAVAAAMQACQALGSYLLLTVLLGAWQLSWGTGGRAPRQAIGWTAPAFAGCVLAGVLLLAVQRLTARHCRRSGLVPARLPRRLALPLWALGLAGLTLGEYAFFVGDVMGQLSVPAGLGDLVLASEWAMVICGLRSAVRLLATLARPVTRRAPGRSRPDPGRPGGPGLSALTR